MKTYAIIDKPAAHKVSQALTNLLLQEPFWGALALSLEYVEDKNVETETTDGTHVRYNPAFINTLTIEQVKSEICHEVNHCVRLHPYRRGTRDNKLWNTACDYRINEDMVQDRYQLDNTWLRAPWPIINLSEEQIYSKIEQQPKTKQSQCHCHVEDAPSNQNQDDTNHTAQDWKSKLLQTAMLAQQNSAHGNIPASLLALVDILRNPKIDWRAATRKFLEQTARNDFSWELPDRYYVQSGIYVPSLHSEQLPPVCFYWDTSGSRWSSEQRQSAATELIGMVQEARPEVTYVIYGDTKVRRVDAFSPNDVIKLEPIGGGGTDFRPIFKYIETQGIVPCCFIGMTDLAGDFPAHGPEYPVLWVTDVKGAKAPFGDILYI